MGSNRELVDHLWRSGTIKSPAVKRALLACPRDAFVPAAYREVPACSPVLASIIHLQATCIAPYMWRRVLSLSLSLCSSAVEHTFLPAVHFNTSLCTPHAFVVECGKHVIPSSTQIDVVMSQHGRRKHCLMRPCALKRWGSTFQHHTSTLLHLKRWTFARVTGKCASLTFMRATGWCASVTGRLAFMPHS
jgi:hypothetical protein